MCAVVRINIDVHTVEQRVYAWACSALLFHLVLKGTPTSSTGGTWQRRDRR